MVQLKLGSGFLRLRGAYPHGQFPVTIRIGGLLVVDAIAERSIEEGRTAGETRYNLISKNVQHAGASVTVEGGSDLLQPIATALQTGIADSTEPPPEVVGNIVTYNGTTTQAALELYYWTGQQVYETKDGLIGAVWPPDSKDRPIYVSNYNTVIGAGAEAATAPARVVNKAIVRGGEEL